MKKLKICVTVFILVLLISCGNDTAVFPKHSFCDETMLVDKTISTVSTTETVRAVMFENNLDSYTLDATFSFTDWAGIVFATDTADISGYCFTVSENSIALKKIVRDSEKISFETLSEKKLTLNRECVNVKIEKSGFVYRFYIITDEKVEPWWELEYTLLNVSDCYYGFLDSGSGSECKKLSITEFSLKSFENTYQNPVFTAFQAADPDVIYHDGTYYCYSTSASIGYYVYTSKDLVNWENKGLCMGSAWGFENEGMYWAPGVTYYNGKFYMIASVNEHLGFAVADSPLGPFIPEENYLFEGAIDGQIFVDDDGKAYLYYVSWSEKEGYGIYGCELESDIVTPKLDTVKKLIFPEYDWETVDGAVTEGPFMIKHNGIYYLTYSGTGYGSKDYAVGYAVGTSPLGKFVKDENNPAFIKSQYLFGVGHHCFVTSPDNSELFIVYHAHNSDSRVHPRVLCIDRARFEKSENEVDRLRILGPTFFKQPYPSGAK